MKEWLGLSISLASVLIMKLTFFAHQAVNIPHSDTSPRVNMWTPQKLMMPRVLSDRLTINSAS